MNAPPSQPFGAGVEAYIRARVRLGRAMAEYDDGRDIPVERLTSPTPCRGCVACCKSGMTVTLAPQESADGLDVETTASGEHHLRQRTDGSCVHLTDSNTCAVYSRRPVCCRAYDCRDLVVGHVAPISHPPLNQAAQRWKVEFRTRDDREAFERIGTLTHALLATGDDVGSAIMRAMLLYRQPPDVISAVIAEVTGVARSPGVT